MRYQESLQVRLQERYRRLYKANWQAYGDEAGYLVAFIQQTPALRAITENLETSIPDLDPAEWARTHFGHNQVEFPPTEVGRAKLAWYLLREWSANGMNAATFGHNLDYQTDLPGGARLATEQVVEPLIEYLQEQLGSASDVLYLLERYVRRFEWFDRRRLYDEYAADPARGEAIYDADLRRFLFEQGIDYPFSQPSSGSGEADVVADLETDDPLVCEVKLFNADSYGAPYIGKGFRQAVEYAHDYGKTTAYLVIFNLSEKRLQLPTVGEQNTWPARIETEGVTVYLVAVRAFPAASASKQTKTETVVVTTEHLLMETQS